MATGDIESSESRGATLWDEQCGDIHHALQQGEWVRRRVRRTIGGEMGAMRRTARLVIGSVAVVVVAGMEGALASVVGGLTAAPVVAVPTSVGYGSSLEGVTALLGMLASCASGLTVVGVDNGFGAAIAVLRALGTSIPVRVEDVDV